MASVYASYPPSSGSGGGGAITSINGDTTAAQLIVGGTGITVGTVAGTTTITATGGGSGTVTSVSVTTANGVSGSVATATTTPAISLTLGAITPSSVAAVGTVTGSNLSGTNTGDQTITLTSDVTGSGTGSFATTIAAGAVTNAKIAAAAGISVNKLAALSASTAVASDASGFLVSSATTAAELAFVNGVTSAIQTQINNKQPLDATLTALAAYNTNGILTQTAADTFTGRTITGTANRITSTNGDGVSGNPTIDISASYVGQASITTLGTIGTGTWNGTTIAIANGGTGQTTANPAFNALSPLTTKGDIVGFSTVNARLPVGTNGQVLAADSGETLGIKWADPTVLNTSRVFVGVGSGSASGNTAIATFSSIFTNIGSDITYVSDTTNGDTFTINATGVYAMSHTNIFTIANYMGISLNSNQLSTGIESITDSDALTMTVTQGTDNAGNVGVTLYLTAGDIIRAHNGNNFVNSASFNRAKFIIQRVS